MNKLLSPSIPRASRLAPVLCVFLAGGLLFGASSGFAAEAGGQPAAEAPVIESESESNMTEDGVTLEAQINPEGSETEYELWIECGWEGYQGQEFPCGSSEHVLPERVAFGRLPAGDTGDAVSVALSDLLRGEGYKYWVVATSSEGTTKGAVRIFAPSESWPGPVSETGVASKVGERGVILEGYIHPTEKDYGEYEYFFEYGADTSYGASSPSSPKARIIRLDSCLLICKDEWKVPVPVSVSVTGLEPGTTYHYRLVTTDAEGYRSFGEDATFTTGGEKPSLPSNGNETPSTTGGGGQPGASNTPSSLTAGVTPLVSPLVKAVEPKSLTKTQKLAKALKQCEKEPKRKRAACERQAKKKYATAAGDTGKKASERNRTRRR
jgi:hypothetical protein